MVSGGSGVSSKECLFLVPLLSCGLGCKFPRAMTVCPLATHCIRL